MQTNLKQYYSFEEYMSSPIALYHRKMSEQWLSDWQNSDSYKKHIDTITKDTNLNQKVLMIVSDECVVDNNKANYIDINYPEEITKEFAYKVYVDSLHSFFLEYKYIPAKVAWTTAIYIEGLPSSIRVK